MSRVYTIKVHDRLRQVVHLGDRVTTRVELLEVLPPAEMAEHLAAALEARGFAVEDGVARRVEPDGVRMEVALDTGVVTVSLEREADYEREGERQARSARSSDAELDSKLRAELLDHLQREIDSQRAADQTELTRTLERRLGELQSELDQVGNRATAAALKQKARQLGQVRSVEEDPESGAVRIVVEL